MYIEQAHHFEHIASSHLPIKISNNLSEISSNFFIRFYLCMAGTCNSGVLKRFLVLNNIQLIFKANLLYVS